MGPVFLFMIHILFGPGGSGKSYLQVMIIINQLRNTMRNVCTNLSLDIPKLNEYCEKQYPKEKLDVGGRVRILTTEETKMFWKYRGPEVYAEHWDGGGGRDVLIENKGEWGVCYVLDEAGAAGFSAQEWAQSIGRTTRGVECSWYLDQQRKFSDDVFASTNGRGPGGIAKGFRDKAHVFIKLRNGYLRQMGVFKATGRFEAFHYSSEPGPNSEHFKREEWKLDTTGVAACYRTQDGVGVAGKNADIGSRAKGIPILWIFPMVIAGGSLIVIIPWLLGKGFAKSVDKTAARIDETAAVMGGGKGPVRDAQASGPASREASPVEVVEPVYVDGLAYGPRGPVAWLSDGTELMPEEIALVGRDGIITRGQLIFKFPPKKLARENISRDMSAR